MRLYELRITQPVHDDAPWWDCICSRTADTITRDAEARQVFIFTGITRQQVIALLKAGDLCFEEEIQLTRLKTDSYEAAVVFDGYLMDVWSLLTEQPYDDALAEPA